MHRGKHKVRRILCNPFCSSSSSLYLSSQFSSFGSRASLTICLLVSLLSLAVSPSHAAEGATYGGLEFFGSSQMTHDEVEKSLHLRPGASEKSVEANAESLRKKIEKLRLQANVQIVVDPPDKLFVVVDFEDKPGHGVPIRTLKQPHHVITQSEKPELLLQKLRARIDRLNQEGRDWKDSYPGGVRMFSDEPANQIVTELRRYCPTMRDEFLEITISDPDHQRRCDAIELLNWAGTYVDTCAQLIGSIDDSHLDVRGAADEFIFPRLEKLPDNFPYDQLALSLVRQLKRPSHADRNRSIHFIMALIRKYPKMVTGFRRTCEKDVERFATESKISTLRKTADDLLLVLRAGPPPPPPTNIPSSGF